MSGKPRIVVDTNVMISAAGWMTGNPRAIVEVCFNGSYQLIETRELLEELSRVISQPKFHFLADEKDEFLEMVDRCALLVHPKEKCDVITDDPSDNMVLECAIEGRADCIVSGDRHLLALKGFRGIPILTPKKFLKRYPSYNPKRHLD